MVILHNVGFSLKWHLKFKKNPYLSVEITGQYSPGVECSVECSVEVNGQHSPGVECSVEVNGQHSPGVECSVEVTGQGAFC